MSNEFDWVAAFTGEAFGGNACMVVHNCQDLDLLTRLKIVQETSLVECNFLGPSVVADFRFRIYLASHEIPFAGHPTLAGVASLIERGLVKGKRLTVETEAGIIPIEIDANNQIVMTQIAPIFGPFVASDKVAEALSLNVDDIIAPPQVVSTGLPFTITVLKDHDALMRARLSPSAFLNLQSEIDFPGGDVMEPFLVTLRGATKSGDTYSRLLLAPPMPPEDPFTGSATGAMASYLWANALISNCKFVAEQGHAMKRPGHANVEVLGDPKNITGVRVAGKAHVTMSGKLHL